MLTVMVDKGELGSDSVAAVETAYKALRANHPDLPAVVFIVGRGRARVNTAHERLGHYRDNSWRQKHARSAKTAEIFIAGERLKTGAGAVDTFTTIVHEATHALAGVRELKDTSRQHRYHNRSFLRLAEELGLHHPGPEPHSVFGFSDVRLRPETRALYEKTIRELGASLVAHIPDDVTGAGGDRNYIKAVCGCPRTIRAWPAVLDQGGILCRLCKAEFRAA